MRPLLTRLLFRLGMVACPLVWTSAGSQIV